MYADLMLSWDAQVSAVHTELQRLADDWVLVDDGLSRNGSFVNGERVSGRRRLTGGDELRFGRTVVVFRSPFPAVEQDTASHEIPSDLGPG
jgi:pSer/pThr/pTyr-binding forkhead associated (FHA) protein